MPLLDPDLVLQAAGRIAPYVRRTRLLRSTPLSERVSAPVHLKLENEQTTGSFKLRGAINVIATLDEETRRRGVVASSAGNHGLGVAYAAKQFGVDATLFLPARAPRVKRDGIAALGAAVDQSQPHYDAAMDAAKAFAAARGSRFINPCLGDDLLAGQGTVALEILAECPRVQTLVLSVGGGGLLGGCASVVRGHAPSVKILGAQSVNTAAMSRSLSAGRVTEIENVSSLADGLAGQIDEEALEIGRLGLDGISTVTEDEIGAAIGWLHREHQLRVEGAGAVGVAALLAGKLQPVGDTVVIVSGGNIDPERWSELAGLAG